MLTAAALTLATAAAPLEITLSRTAGLKIREEGEPVADIGFSMAQTGWNFVPLQSSGSPANPMPAKAVWAGGEAAISGQVTTLADGLRFELKATPNATVGTELTCLSASFPTGLWAGGSAVIDGTSVPIPPTYQDLSLWGGNAKTLVMNQSGIQITIDGDQTRSCFLQDSRQWGPNVEWRYGIDSGTWNSGAQRTYTVTLKTNRQYTFAIEEPYTINAGTDWLPMTMPLDPKPGSALDWSPAKTKPAGSDGWVTVQNGKFSVGGKPQRFYGANLAFSACYMPNADCDRLAARLASLGYNTVRLHHFDVDLTGGWTTQGANSTALDPAKLDRLNYLVGALKKKGIYISLDLFTIRQIRENEVMPGLVGTDEYKALTLVLPAARNNLLDFARNLLNTTNPYTGLKWKDDPAIAFIHPVNENTLGSSSLDMQPASRALLDQAWQAAGHTGPWTYEADEGARFAAKLHDDFFVWIKSQLRAMGVKCLLSDLNGWRDQRVYTDNRARLDYVDNHNYWDHPNFLGAPWGPPSRGWSGGGMAVKQLGGGFTSLALSRSYGRPFTVTEYNFVAPNRYRSEAGLLMGSFAARQDWDSVYRFAWSHSMEAVQSPQAMDYFNVQTDPVALATEKAVIALFLRRDLEPAADSGILKVDPAAAGVAGGYSAPMQDQILSRKLYSSPTTGGNGDMPAPTAPQPVTVDRNAGLLTVNTPRTQGFFAPIGREVKTDALTGILSGHRGALWVSSLDGRAINTSSRMLLTFVTDCQNSGIRFSGPDRDVMESWGALPYLARAGSAQVALRHDNPSLVRVYRLDMAGNRVENVPVTVGGKTVSFTASIGGTGGPTWYYELEVVPGQRVRFTPGFVP